MASDNNDAHRSHFLSRFTHRSKSPATYLFAADVLFRLADMEAEAAAFYRGLARFSDLGWIQAFAGKLADAEMRHRSYFLELAADAQSIHGKNQLPSPLPWDIAQLLNTRITMPPESVSKTDKYYGEKDAIQFAILTEENTISLLKKLRPFVPAGQHEHMDIVLEEEHKHKRLLEALWRDHFADSI